MNDVDGLVLISILNSQIGSICVVFLFCLGLFWLQHPVIDFRMFPQSAVWARFCSYVISQMIEPSPNSWPKILNWTDFLQSFANQENVEIRDTRGIFLLHVFTEIGIYAIIVIVVLRTTMGYLHKFYKLGSDPMGIQSSSKTQNKNKTIKVSSESSGNVSTASGNSSFDAASYFSPSNVILSSIKRCNASAAKSGYSDPAIEPTKWSGDFCS